MRSVLRKHYFLPNVCQSNSNTYCHSRHISPGTVENAILTHLTKKSNYFKAEFYSYHHFLAFKRTKSRKHVLVKSIYLGRFMTSESTETLILRGRYVEHIRQFFLCQKEDLLKVIYKGFLNSYLVLYASEKSSRNHYVENFIRINHLIHKLQRCFSSHLSFFLQG